MAETDNRAISEAPKLDKLFSSFLFSVEGKVVKVVVQGREYEYDMADEYLASKAEWMFRYRPFFVALNWLKARRVNERRV